MPNNPAAILRYLHHAVDANDVRITCDRSVIEQLADLGLTPADKALADTLRKPPEYYD